MSRHAPTAVTAAEGRCRWRGRVPLAGRESCPGRRRARRSWWIAMETSLAGSRLARRTRARVDASEAFAGIPDRSQQRRPVGSVGRARRRSPRPRRLSTFDSLADGGLIHRHGLSNESFECLLIDLLALMHIDRTAQVAFEDGVEQA